VRPAGRAARGEHVVVVTGGDDAAAGAPAVGGEEHVAVDDRVPRPGGATGVAAVAVVAFDGVVADDRVAHEGDLLRTVAASATGVGLFDEVVLDEQLAGVAGEDALRAAPPDAVAAHHAAGVVGVEVERVDVRAATAAAEVVVDEVVLDG
jgi:hypothetical protein